MPTPRFTVEQFFRLEQPASRVPLHLAPDGRYLTLTVRAGGRRRALAADSEYTADGVPWGMAGGRVLVVGTTTGRVTLPFGGQVR